MKMKIAEVVSTPPPILYHVASSQDRESIMKYGLLRAKSQAYDVDPNDKNLSGAIFFSNKPSYNGDLWQVDVRGLTIEPDESGSYDLEDPSETWWVTFLDDVPPNRLKLIWPTNI